MESTIKLTQVPSLLKNNWFKILVGSLLLILFLKKDFSFQINMDSPNTKTVPGVVPASKLEKPKEVFTDKSVAVASRQKLGLGLLGSSQASIDLNTELSKVEQASQMAYLKRFAHVAISERKKFNIPSSIILANALLASTCGQRATAKLGNNHFAIPCGSDWEGANFTHDGTCFRQYENAWASFRNHSEYLTSGKFSELKGLHPKDYKGWARALKKAGLSNDSNYDKALIKIIETYSLQELDEK